jgi:hypothetical protein
MFYSKMSLCASIDIVMSNVEFFMGQFFVTVLSRRVEAPLT